MQTMACLPMRFSPSPSPTVVVVLPSPAGVGLIAVTSTSLPSGCRPARARDELLGDLGLVMAIGQDIRPAQAQPGAAATSAMGALLASRAISISDFMSSPSSSAAASDRGGEPLPIPPGASAPAQPARSAANQISRRIHVAAAAQSATITQMSMPMRTANPAQPSGAVMSSASPQIDRSTQTTKENSPPRPISAEASPRRVDAIQAKGRASGTATIQLAARMAISRSPSSDHLSMGP